jgi:hypothetical protein
LSKEDKEKCKACTTCRKKSSFLLVDAKHVGVAQAKFKYDAASSSSASSFLKKLKGKALMAKLHRDETAALYHSYPKDYAVCREAGLYSC